MTPVYRRLNDIWKAIDHLRIAEKMKSREWKQSYAGVKAALEHVGLVMATTKHEFAALPIPLDNKTNKKQYMNRKICVSRNGNIQAEAPLCTILTGNSGLLTTTERKGINDKKSTSMTIARPTGFAHSNVVETNAIDTLHVLIKLNTKIYSEHLIENRLADVAYCLPDVNKALDVFVPDQVKSSRAADNGRVTFHAHHGVMMVQHMKAILQKNMSLTLIGANAVGQIDVVWLFHGSDAIEGLESFDETQRFSPRLHSKISEHAAKPFNKFINRPEHRFDVLDSDIERKRLLDRRLNIVHIGQKQTLTFLNEDMSQIPGVNHRIEQKAFEITRKACAKVDIMVTRQVQDGYGPVDFRVSNHEFEARIQDKSTNGTAWGLRPDGRHPYNPDTVDILQLTNVRQGIVYALPMRIVRDGLIESFFTSEQLMKSAITGTKYLAFQFDLNTDIGAQGYVSACMFASRVPPLSDKSFYKNMIEDNKHKFGSKRSRQASTI